MRLDGKQPCRGTPSVQPYGRDFPDINRRAQRYRAVVFDERAPFKRVWYPDGDWEEMSRRQRVRGVEDQRQAQDRENGQRGAAKDQEGNGGRRGGS